MRGKRDLGVWFCVISMILIGLTITAFEGWLLTFYIKDFFLNHYFEIDILPAILFIAIGFSYIILSVNILNFKNWARFGGVIFSGLSVLLFSSQEVYIRFISPYPVWTWPPFPSSCTLFFEDIFGLPFTALSIIILIYFSLPKVKRQFI